MTVSAAGGRVTRPDGGGTTARTDAEPDALEQVTAAIAKDSVTAGPEKLAAALAPTEKIPAPTATATPMIMRSQVLRDRLSLRPGSSASAIDCSIDLVRRRFIRESLS